FIHWSTSTVFRMQLPVLIGTLVLIGIVSGEFYNPRGWRPSGPSFSLHQNNRLHSNEYNSKPGDRYGPPPADSYPGPSNSITPSVNGPGGTSTTEPSLGTRMTATAMTITTPRTREPTTPFNLQDDDPQLNPALAVANSFAFNRPVYIYNGYPLYPGLTFVK
ncbi:GSCOCG00013340001-RA-CDS, partial [Cotesia congregata]